MQKWVTCGTLGQKHTSLEGTQPPCTHHCCILKWISQTLTKCLTKFCPKTTAAPHHNVAPQTAPGARDNGDTPTTTSIQGQCRELAPALLSPSPAPSAKHEVSAPHPIPQHRGRCSARCRGESSPWCSTYPRAAPHCTGLCQRAAAGRARARHTPCSL